MKLRLWMLMLAAALAAVAQESKEPSAPPVLSRGFGPGLLRSGMQAVGLRGFANVTGMYESGLTAYSVGEDGEIPNDSSAGMVAGIGAYGYKRWKRTLLGLDYRGNYSHYVANSYYDGTDHSLSLGVSYQATKRTSVTLRQTAGTASRGWGMYSPYGFADPTYAQLPTQELFNNRTYHMTSMADLTFEKSARLSFNIGGSTSFIERRSKSLAGNMGTYARGDVMYRLSRNQTIGVDYAFSHYSYSGSFGSAFMHMGALNWATRLGRSWTFSARGGLLGVDTQGLIRVSIDPVIAALIGRSYGVEIYQRQNMVFSGGATLQRQFRKSSIGFSYSDGATPGNGLYLASRNRTAGAHYSYSGIRRWNFGASFDYSEFSSLSRDLGVYRGYGGGVGANCNLGRGLHFTSRFDTRNYKLQDSGFNRTSHRVSIGLSYSTGEGPLSLY